MIFWMILLGKYLYRFAGQGTESMYFLVGILLLLDLLSYGIFVFGLWKNIKILKYLLLPFLVSNAILSITDQLGFWDIAALLMNISTILVYLQEKKTIKCSIDYKIKNHNFLSSFKHAFNGISIAIKRERNVKIELAITFIVITACILLEISFNQILIVILCCTFVISIEFLNSALERVVDLVTCDYHDLAKQAKDLAAGAVLIASIGSAIIGFFIFFPKIMIVFFI